MHKTFMGNPGSVSLTAGVVISTVLGSKWAKLSDVARSMSNSSTAFTAASSLSNLDRLAFLSSTSVSMIGAMVMEDSAALVLPTKSLYMRGSVFKTFAKCTDTLCFCSVHTSQTLVFTITKTR